MAHNKRDSAAAGLPWPGHAPRAEDSDEEDMSILAFTNPSESATTGEPLPSATYTSAPDIAPPFQAGAEREEVPPHQPYGNDRTVHTIIFKLWNPQSKTSRELFIQETRADGTTKS